ncbi:MAG: hypothetical protein KGJ13_11160, partial [Patescibacteria group bacterium]|nr:hypothetical protein [Patescibacteria group bacterium]
MTFATTVKAVTVNLPLSQSFTSLTGSATSTTPCSTVINFYGFALFISGILAFGAIVYGGIRYAVSAGNPSGQSEGIDWIKGALFGVLLLASAYVLLNIVNPALVKCELPTLKTLPQTPIPQCQIGVAATASCTCGNASNAPTCASGQVCGLGSATSPDRYACLSASAPAASDIGNPCISDRDCNLGNGERCLLNPDRVTKTCQP